MGISGLLPFLKDAIETVHLKQLEGYVVAVDTYCWIYKGAFSVAEQLGMGQNTDGHVKYVLKYVNKLLDYNIKPIMIFDGCCLPSKKHTEAKRRENKEMYRKKAAQCLLDGKRNEARECFQRCLEVTQKMAHEVIKALHDMGVDVLVAPYEADAQLTYLNKMNIAHIVITEDSDLILFGCKKILYKLDLNGNGSLLHKEKIDQVTQFESGDKFEKFRWMCILSGCDYLDNLPGIGLGKARKLLKQTRKTEIEMILKIMSQNLKMPNLIVTQDYIEKFVKADKTFKYQIVFDPLQRKLVSLNEYGVEVSENEDLSYAGTFYEHDLALQLALGNLNVNDKTPVDDFDPSRWKYKPPYRYMKNTPSYMKSVWSSDYSPREMDVKLSGVDEEDKSNALKELNRISTKNVEKTIDTSCIIKNQVSSSSVSIKTTIQSSTVSIESPTVMKRKYDENDENRLMTPNFNDNNTPTQKKFKLDEIKCDIDNILQEYTTNAEKDENELESSYFTSSNHMSPVLRRSSQKSSGTSSQSSISQSNPSSTSGDYSSSDVNNPPFRMNERNKSKKKDKSKLSLDAKLSLDNDNESSTIMNGSALKIIFDSPVIEQKKNTENNLDNNRSSLVRKDISNFFENFSKKPINSLKLGLESDVKPTVIVDSDDENVNVTSNEKKLSKTSNILQSKVNSKDLINDLENIDTNRNASANNTQSIKQKSSKIVNNGKVQTKPISEYFIKFEYKKSNENKLKINN